MLFSISDDLHGGNIYHLARNLQLHPQAILDFSSNINPLGMPEPLKKLLIEHIDGLTRYPDPDYQTLRENIAYYLDVPLPQIIPGNGASEIIYTLLNTLRPPNLLLCAPTFSEYEKAAQLAAVNFQYHTLSEEDGFQLDSTKLLNGLGPMDCILLCNPNNPTSTLLPPAKMIRLTEDAKQKKVTLIVDESFIELTAAGNRNSLCPWLQYYDNLFIIRSFTKILAIPGLRLGYGLGPAPWIEKIVQNKLPWSVNALASAVGDYLSEIPDFLARTALWLNEEKNWLFQELQKIPSLKPFAPQSNFILVKILLPNLTAAELQMKLAAQGILIRNASNFHSLNEQFFRIAVKDRTSNEYLVERMKNCLSKFPGSKMK